MSRLELKVSGMTCGHCVRAVTEALQSVPGVTVEQVTIGAAVVSLEGNGVSAGDVIDAVSDAGYEAVETVG